MLSRARPEVKSTRRLILVMDEGVSRCFVVGHVLCATGRFVGSGARRCLASNWHISDLFVNVAGGGEE